MPSEHVLGVHLLLPAVVARRVRSVQRGLGRRLLGEYHRYQPHITLYLARYTPTRFRRLIEHFRRHPPAGPILTFVDSRHTRSWRGRPYFFLRAKPDGHIAGLHRTVLAVANQLRGDLIRTKDRLRIQRGQHSKRRGDLIRRYGHYQVLGAFKPHVSLAETERVHLHDVLQLIRRHLHGLYQRKFQAKKMVIGLYRYNTRTEKYARRHHEVTIPLRTAPRAPVRRHPALDDKRHDPVRADYFQYSR